MNIGIIGYGGMGRKHADIAKQRNHSVVAICDPNYHGVNAADLATTMEISDGVVVAVPVGIRDTIASDILMWNKPILWEKPIALDPLVSNQVLSHSKLVVAENWSWSELGSNVTRGSIIILNFVLQNLQYVQSWAKDVKIGGGAFVEGGSHAITWFLHRTGYKSENIQQITAAYR